MYYLHSENDVFYCVKMASPDPFLSYKPLKGKIMGIFISLYCCYGNLQCQRNDYNLFTSNWAFVDAITEVSTEKIRCINLSKWKC